MLNPPFFFQNNLLKTSNEELRARLQMVSEENSKLKDRLGMAPLSTSSDHEYAAPCPTKSRSEQTKHMKYDTNSNDSDSNHIVIKTEEASPEYASFRMISQQQKFQILLLSLITIWLHSLRYICLFTINNHLMLYEPKCSLLLRTSPFNQINTLYFQSVKKLRQFLCCTVFLYNFQQNLTQHYF